MEKITAESVVGATELACVLGLTARRVQQLAQDGVFVPVSRGKYELADCVQKYIRLQTKPKTDQAVADAERRKTVSDADLKEAKAKVAKMQAEELEGNMHRSEDVAAMTEDLIYTIRSSINALPGRVAVDVAAVSTAAEAAEVIKKECHKILRELADYRYDPIKYEERVRARLSMDEPERDEDA